VTTSVSQRLDDLVLHLKGLVHVRALRESSGAPAREIDIYTAEITNLQLRIAAIVRETGGG
jgi:hypothetical protein